MTTPRIEEMAQEYRKIEKTRPWWNKLKEALEQKDKYNYSTVDAIDLKFAIEDYQRLHHQLQKAREGLKARIELLLENNTHRDNMDFSHGYRNALLDIESYLSELDQDVSSK